MANNILDIEAIDYQYVVETADGPKRSALRSPETRIRTWSAADIAALDMPEPTWVVPGLLPAGVHLIVGAPKVGKTHAGLMLAKAVAEGGDFLDRTVEAAPVLYLWLEGGVRLLHHRLKRLEVGGALPANLEMGFECDRLHAGLESQMNAYLLDNPTCRLIIVDTLVRVNPQVVRRGSQYEQDAETLRQMELLGKAWPDTAFLFVHHTRETLAEDPLDAAYGSRGLTGTIDTGWVMTNGPVKGDVRLQVKSRQLEDEPDLALKFNGAGGFDVTGRGTDFIGGETRQELLDALKESGKPMNAKALNEATGIDLATIRQVLSRMKKSDQVVKTAKGLYELPPLV